MGKGNIRKFTREEKEKNERLHISRKNNTRYKEEDRQQRA